jgi:hypothetical protein
MMSTEMGKDQPVVDEVSRAIARIQTGVLTIAFAALCGLGLFLMTAWLLLRDGPNVGAHLQLLGNYFPGYSVTWPGSVIGFLYGVFVGGVVGWSIGTIYNKVVGVRHVSTDGNKG